MRKFIILILAFTYLSSCIKVVDIDVDEIPTLLVVNCLFTENQPFRVNVSRLASYPDLGDRNIEDATVTLFENDNLMGELIYTGEGIYTNPSLVPVRGNIYSINVEASGYPIATASDSLPWKVNIDDCNYKLEAGKDYEGDNYDEISVLFSDNTESSYYSIQVYNEYEKEVYDEKWDILKKEVVWSPIDLFTSDPVIVAEGVAKSDYSDYFVFNDVLFANGKYRLSIKFYSQFNSGKKFKVVLESGTENYFQYRKRLIKHDSYSYQDPFKPYSPVPLFSNLENGLGIFAGFQRDIFLLTLN